MSNSNKKVQSPKIFTLHSQKGGVGKTSIALAIAGLSAFNNNNKTVTLKTGYICQFIGTPGGGINIERQPIGTSGGGINIGAQCITYQNKDAYLKNIQAINTRRKVLRILNNSFKSGNFLSLATICK